MACMYRIPGNLWLPKSLALKRSEKGASHEVPRAWSKHSWIHNVWSIGCSNDKDLWQLRNLMRLNNLGQSPDKNHINSYALKEATSHSPFLRQSNSRGSQLEIPHVVSLPAWERDCTPSISVNIWLTTSRQAPSES